MQHLGAEFQQLAQTRAAELTEAYRTLTNAELRAEYDATLAGAPAAPAVASASSHPSTASRVEPAAAEPATSAPRIDRFQQARADRDGILRRAVLERVRHCFADDYEVPFVNGFDLALTPRSRSAVFRRHTRPTLLVRVADKIDAPLVIDAWTHALRARALEKPVALVLLAREVDRRSFAEIVEERRKKYAAMAESIIPVALNLRDWHALVPAHAPDSVRTAVERLRNFAS